MKPRHFLMTLALSLPLIASADPIQFQALSPETPINSTYEHLDDIEAMRAARVQERIDQISALLNLTKGTGRTCKYISGLSTPPPPGRVALTFDDGPDARLTPYVLDVLKKYRIQATFFMKGENATAHPDLVARADREGHFIGNHSWNHPNFHKLSAQDQRAQVVSTERPLGPYLNSPKLFRYPYGNSTCSTNDFVHERGYQIVGWHVDSCDWGFAETGRVSARDADICGVQERNRGSFVNHVVAQTVRHNGGIILMHDIHGRTIHQLEIIITELLQRGYEFTTLADPGLQDSMR